MQRAPDKPHAKYPHVYAIVRIDSYKALENSATVVKVMATRDQAEQEAARLRRVNEGKQCIYEVQITRFVGTPTSA
jgi:predicted DNA-binding ArsR family transcriptional regulator